jgi:heme A synthase
MPMSERSTGHRLLRVVALASVGATFALIAVGALVRATGSGEGCPGWPRCFGRWVPPFTYHPGVGLTNALIEYSHRFTASLVFVLVALLAVVAWRRYRDVPRVFRVAMVAVGLWLFQAVLGGLVVHYGLPAWLVTAHLVTAMLFVGTLVVVAVAAFSVDAHPVGPFDGFTRLAWAAAAGALALIAVGALVRGEGAGLAFADWPLMDGRVVPAFDGVIQRDLMFVHRLLALGVGIQVGALMVRAWRDRRVAGRHAVSPAFVLAWTAGGLFVVQVLIGAANVRTRLAVGPVVAHVAVASLIWGSLVATAAAARVCALRRRLQPLPGTVEPAGRTARHDRSAVGG